MVIPSLSEIRDTLIKEREWIMSQATIAIPPSVTESEARLYLSMKLFEIGRLSCGQAAELAGYSKRTYMELLGKHGVAAIDYPASELQDDLGNA